MSSEFVEHGPCDACGSSDALAVYSDGHAHCFSCQKTSQPPKGNHELMSSEAPVRTPFVPVEHTIEALVDRSISRATCQKYGYAVAAARDGRHVMPYHDVQGRLVAHKIRHPDKRFAWIGDAKAAALFGQRLWSPGKRVVITEGEIDAMSVAQAMGLRWPAVSLKNGAAGAKKELAAQLPWLEGFDEVVLMFDADEPGQKAALACAELFTPGRARLAALPLKDANEMLVAGRAEELVRAVWEAAPFRPDGIVSGVDLIDRVLQPPPPSTPYPWGGLNEKLRGMRRGELTTWCGGTGGGKSQVVREIAYALRSRGEAVGIIALEESVVRAALAQVSLEMGAKLHDPAVRASVGDEAIRKAAGVALAGVHFYEHFGSVDPDVLLPRIRFMAKALDVRWIVLDHISIMISGNATEGDERKRIDELMTRLRMLVEELQVGVHIVSHLRKAGGTPHEEGGRISMDDLRGSGAIKQVSDNIVALERDQQAEDAEVRNTTLARVLKCRLFGETGPASYLRYSSETGRISETEAPGDGRDGRGSEGEDDGFGDF